MVCQGICTITIRPNFIFLNDIIYSLVTFYCNTTLFISRNDIAKQGVIGAIRNIDAMVMISINNTITDSIEAIKSYVSPLFDDLHKRLDSIEAQLAVQSKAMNEQTGKPKSRSAEEKESLKQIKEALNKIKGFKTN